MLADAPGSISQDARREQRRLFDPVGHDARPDVFRLTVETRCQTPVDFVWLVNVPDGWLRPRSGGE